MSSTNQNPSRGNTTRTFSTGFPGRAVIGSGPTNSGAIIIQNCEIRDYETGEAKYSGKNAEIALLVGANGPDWPEDKPITYVNYGKTPAGLVLSERTTPAFVLAQDERGIVKASHMLNVPQRISEGGKPEAVPKVAESVNSAEPTLTAWGGTVNLASFNGGINLYTTPFAMKSKARGDNSPSDNRTRSVGNTGVSLIHKNNIKTLEPMVKGNKLAAALNGYSDDMQKALSQIHETHVALLKLSVKFAAHEHIVAGVGAAVAAPSITAIVAAVGSVPKGIKNVIDNVFSDLNTVFKEFNVSMATEKTYLSHFHSLN